MTPILRDTQGRYVKGSRRHALPILQRYAVDPTTNCWLWLGNIDKRHGYGRCRGADGRTLLAHRVLYEHHKGEIPQGTELDHLCRVRRCVNPDHLEPVTRAVNVQRGASAKLNPDAVREIRRVMDALCEKYDVTPSALRFIAERRSWKEVEDH